MSSSDDSSPDSSPELPAKDVSPIFSPFDLKHASPPTTPLVPVVESTKVKVKREAEVVSEGYLKIQQWQKVTLPQMPKKPDQELELYSHKPPKKTQPTHKMVLKGVY